MPLFADLCGHIRPLEYGSHCCIFQCSTFCDEQCLLPYAIMWLYFQLSFFHDFVTNSVKRKRKQHMNPDRVCMITFVLMFSLPQLTSWAFYVAFVCLFDKMLSTHLLLLNWVGFFLSVKFSKLLLALAIPSGLVVKSLGDDALESESIQPISLNFPNRWFQALSYTFLRGRWAGGLQNCMNKSVNFDCFA